MRVPIENSSRQFLSFKRTLYVVVIFHPCRGGVSNHHCMDEKLNYNMTEQVKDEITLTS